MAQILGRDPLNHAWGYKRGNLTCLVDMASQQPQSPLNIANPFYDWYWEEVVVPAQLNKSLSDSLGGGGVGGFFIS